MMDQQLQPVAWLLMNCYWSLVWFPHEKSGWVGVCMMIARFYDLKYSMDSGQLWKSGKFYFQIDPCHGKIFQNGPQKQIYDVDQWRRERSHCCTSLQSSAKMQPSCVRLLSFICCAAMLSPQETGHFISCFFMSVVWCCPSKWSFHGSICFEELD